MTYIVLKAPLNSNQPTNQPAIFKSYLFCHLQWELATDHGFLN